MRRPAEPPRRKQACAAKAIYRKLNGKEAIFAFSADFDRCLVNFPVFPFGPFRNCVFILAFSKLTYRITADTQPSQYQYYTDIMRITPEI